MTTAYGHLPPDIREQLDDMFTYHAPTEEQKTAYNHINAAAKEFAATVITRCPHNADSSAALRKIREARMTANASIACKASAMPIRKT